MESKSLSDVIKIVGVIILLIVTILTWPSLQIEPQKLNSLSPFNNEIRIKNSVWNKGGEVSGFSIIIPSVCILAQVDNNITCKHKGYGGYVNCTTGICNKVYAGKLSREDELTLKLPNNKPLNFSIIVNARGMLGPIIVTKDYKIYFCEKTENENYDCKIK